jgi:multidrug efflux pump subunit AcrB
LADITTIEDGFEQNDFHSQFNRQHSIELAIYRIGNQSPLDIAATVQAVMDDFESQLPEGVQYCVDSNRAEDYRERLSLLTENGILAILSY